MKKLQKLNLMSRKNSCVLVFQLRDEMNRRVKLPTAQLYPILLFGRWKKIKKRPIGNERTVKTGTKEQKNPAVKRNNY